MPETLSLDMLAGCMTRDEFWTTFGRLEHERLDFKRGVPKELLETIPAMAMTDGGFIVHGVADDRGLVGCPLSQNTQDRITRYANECHVEVQVRALDVDGVELTVTAVPEIRGRIVTTPDGRLLRRVGGDCQPLRGDALGRFVRQREEQSAEDQGIARFDVGDIDVRLVNSALKADRRPAVKADGVIRALVDLGVAAPGTPPLGPQLLAAGAILFSKRPETHVRGASVQIVRRTGVGPGPGPSSARTELAGPLVSVLEGILAFIRANTRHYEVVVGTHRESISEYPEEVLREAVLNALAHRDYGLVGSTVDITIWDDRIEVQSPGPLPGHITVDNMRHEHYSRNRRIMRVLKALALVEEYGEGVDRMFGGMEARLMDPPFFVATSSSVTVILRNRFLVDVEDQVWLSLLGQYHLSAGERRALVAARHEGAVTPRRLRELMPEADVDAILGGALAKGLLLRVGERGGTRYELTDEVVLRAGSHGIEARSRHRQLLLDEIRRRGSLSTAEAADLLAEDSAVARQLLNDLTLAGFVRAEGRTRARRYHPA